MKLAQIVTEDTNLKDWWKELVLDYGRDAAWTDKGRYHVTFGDDIMNYDTNESWQRLFKEEDLWIAMGDDVPHGVTFDLVTLTPQQKQYIEDYIGKDPYS